MPDSAPYRTVGGPVEGTLRVRGSRFVGYLDHVRTESDAEQAINTIAADHPDATHVVPAYRIRSDLFREYASDAGEPSGSAGDPMLAVLRGEELENVIAIVVRYYGGTNLGFGGLVRSYQEAVKRALAGAEIVERRPRKRFVVETSYEDSGAVRAVLEASDAEISGTYEETVRFTVAVPLAFVEDCADRLRDVTSGRVTIRDA